MAERIDVVDWADVAAVGLIADVLSTSASRGPVASLLEDLRREWCRDFRGGFTRDVGKAASALREAFEAGKKARIDVLDCDACCERHMTEAGARLVSENRELRRELRALEWLLIHHPDELRALVLADGSGRYSYCARALGWEG